MAELRIAAARRLSGAASWLNGYAGSALARRFATAMVWSTLATVFNQGSTLLANIAIARHLDRPLFGKFILVLSTIQALATFGGLGVGYTATKFLAELRDQQRPRAERVLALCEVLVFGAAVVMGCALLAFAPFVSLRVSGGPEVATLLQLGTAAVFFTALNGYLSGALAGLERYRELGITGVFCGCLYFVACVVGALRWGLPGAVIGLSVSAAVQWIVLRIATFRALRAAGLRPHYAALTEEWPVVTRWIVPGMLSALTAIPALWLGQAFLAKQSNGFSQLALYSAAYSLMGVVLFLPNVANAVGMSLINNALGGGNDSEYHSAFWLNLRATLLIEILGMALLLLFGPFVLRVYGSSFSAAYFVLVVLLLASVPESMTIALNQVLQSKGLVWTAIAAVNVPRDGTILLGAYLLVPRFGALGLAIAYLLGRLVALGCILACVRVVGHGLLRRAAQPVAAMASSTAPHL